MRRLKRFAQLTNTERVLLLRTWCIVAFTRIALWILPLPRATCAVRKIERIIEGVSVEQVVWAVKVVSRYVPQATCLAQALAVHGFLSNAGRESRVQLGVAKDLGRFEAHAWVVCGSEIVIGGPDVSRYTDLTDLQGIISKRWEAGVPQ